MRWIGWVVVAAVLAAMTFARLTDDRERRGRQPHVGPVGRESSGSGAAPSRGEGSGTHRDEAIPESL
jgi:hypothetical protein